MRWRQFPVDRLLLDAAPHKEHACGLCRVSDPLCLCPGLIAHLGICESEPSPNVELHHPRVAGCCPEPAFLESVADKGERLRSSLQEALKGKRACERDPRPGPHHWHPAGSGAVQAQVPCRESRRQMLFYGIDWQALVLSLAAVSIGCMDVFGPKTGRLMLGAVCLIRCRCNSS